MVNITEGVSEFNNCLVEYLMDSNFKYALIKKQRQLLVKDATLKYFFSV